MAVAFALVEIASTLWLSYLANTKQIAMYGNPKQVEKLDKLYCRHHYLPFVPLPNYQNHNNRHNSLGFRGDEIEQPKPKSEFRIACLGGSTTYTTSVDNYKKAYPYLLQDYLKRNHSNITVINAGCGKYSSWESFLNLSFRVLDLEPDLIILYQNINDIHNRLVYPYSAYKADNSGSREPYKRPTEKWWTRSAAFRILATRLGLRQSLAGMLFFRTHDYIETNYTTDFCLQKRMNVYPSKIFEKHPAGEMLKNNPPVYFKKNIENIIALCRANHIPIVLLTFASSPHFPHNPMSYSPEYRHAIEEHNDILRNIALEQDVPVFDFAEEMPIERIYWCDGNHVNEKGSNKKAELIAAYLEQSGLLP